MSGYIFAEVRDERLRQVQKWGEQNHQSVDASRDYDLPTETEAKRVCDEAADNGRLTWVDIALEELAEVNDAPNDVVRRAELVQLAAVLFAWIECLDRRASRAAG